MDFLFTTFSVYFIVTFVSGHEYLIPQDYPVGVQLPYFSAFPSRVSTPGGERIATNPQHVRFGVPVDFSYVERKSSGKVLSAPGCPKSLKGIPWLYSRGLGEVRCFLAGSRGPCGRGRLFTPENGSHYGYCNCDCPMDPSGKTGLHKKSKKKLQFCTGRRRDDSTEIIHTQFAFIPQSKHCFELFSQEFCQSWEWLVKTEDKKVKCETRKCEPGRHLQSNGTHTSCKIPAADSPGPGYDKFGELPKDKCMAYRDTVDLYGTCVKKVKDFVNE